MRNIGLKLFALGIAIVLFSFINSESNSSVLTRDVPVEFISVPQGKVIIAPREPQVEVSIKGPSALVSRIAATPPVFRVKIPDNAENNFTATLEGEDLGLPPYFSVLKIEPAQLAVTLDQVISKDVPISVPRIGTLGEGMKIERLEITPDKVHLSGPATEIQGISSVETYPLDLRDVDHSVRRELAVKTPGEQTDMSPRQAAVVLEVTAVQGEQRFPDLPIEVRSMPGQNYTVEPAVVSVLLTGPQQAVQRIAKEEVLPFVRVRDGSDGGPLLVTLEHLPPAVHAEITPAQVRVLPAAAPAVDVPPPAKKRERAGRGNKS